MRDIRSQFKRLGAAIDAASVFLRYTSCAFILWSPFIAGAACTPQAGDVPPSRFYPNGDGTVTDLESGLTWQRCSIGMAWNGSTCTGKARQLTWSEARQAMAPQGDKHWRLPRLNELALLADSHCTSPRIDATIFPHTPATVFWTSTPQRGTADRVYALGFDRRGVVALTRDETAAVRLVSGRED